MTLFLWCVAFIVISASVLLFIGRGGWPRDARPARAVRPARAAPVLVIVPTPAPALPTQIRDEKPLPSPSTAPVAATAGRQ